MNRGATSFHTQTIQENVAGLAKVINDGAEKTHNKR